MENSNIIVDTSKTVYSNECNWVQDIPIQPINAFEKEMLKNENELLKNIISNSNAIINKAQDNAKASTDAMQTVSMSALKFVNEKYKNAPALMAPENVNFIDF